MDKAELLGRIRQAKAELDEVTAAIPDDLMVAPGPAGTWPGKDQLSHLAAWHAILLSPIRGERQGYDDAAIPLDSDEGYGITGLPAASLDE